MQRPVLICSECGGNDFDVDYSTDCSTNKNGKENWDLSIVCNRCGYLTYVATTEGYLSQLHQINTAEHLKSIDNHFDDN